MRGGCAPLGRPPSSPRRYVGVLAAVSAPREVIMPDWLRLAALAGAAVVLTLAGAVLGTAALCGLYVWWVL